MQCPCCSSLSYYECCEPLHLGAQAQSPKQLMRSRFSAFALNKADYIERSWHISTRPKVTLSDNPTWVQLQIVDSWQQVNKGFVHFRAFYKVENELGMMEEKSDFVREHGHWFYVQGDVLS